MKKTFNTNGSCDPRFNYMVDISERLDAVKKMVDDGLYFTINRARQYGKTTLLAALSEFLKNEYTVISLDFQGISTEDFRSEYSFAAAFSRQMLMYEDYFSEDVKQEFYDYSLGKNQNATLSVLFFTIQKLCKKSKKKIVLLIDEVDSASNNQVFIDFLAQLRFYYLKRNSIKTFQSVILAGVHDIRSIKRKIRPDEVHKNNSPWNIAADFNVDMSFSKEDIAGMLNEYESYNKTGMNIGEISGLLYDYTSGYPYLVSKLCNLIDEQIAGLTDFPGKKAAWCTDGFLCAVKMLLDENTPLFDSLINKLEQYPELNSLISSLLFQGQSIPYFSYDGAIRDAKMFGFIKITSSGVQIANRIFETILYNRFLLNYKEQSTEIFIEGSRSKNQFIIDGHLDMKKVLEKFVETFNYLYGDKNEAFLEDEGRKYFMLFLKPIINGTGNCYVEAETRNRERMDLVIDYHGEQYICELKIWHGNAYNERGEEQLSAYLDYFGLQKGYMLSFNFNKNKEIGVKEITVGNKVITEAVV